MPTYRSRQGDLIDAICLAHYGRTAGVTEAVYAANPGLADIGPALPAGVLITLPEIPAPIEPEQSVRLW